MSVAVAHHVSSSSEPALALGVTEAALRSTRLEIIHVVESLDLDVVEAHRAGISDAVGKVLARVGLSHLEWDVHLVPGGGDVPEVARAILTAVASIKPDVLVIGARRRSPVGKAFLGSVTQTVILDADVPVLVVKGPPPSGGGAG
jgi:nucleotide-binding universal stress UspA family protein